MNWREVLLIVKPETVIKWHRQGFNLYWRWKSKAPVGRPKIDREIRELIGKMSRENPLWGVPRLQSELRLLGYDLAESTVAKYRVRGRTSPSQTWKTFLANHAKQIAAVDFFTVPTITFRNLYCFVVLLHDRRQVIHFNVTAHPIAVWTAQQIVEAFPTDEPYNDGDTVSSRVISIKSMEGPPARAEIDVRCCRAKRRRIDFELSIRRRDRRRVIREWALHRQNGIFDTDRPGDVSAAINHTRSGERQVSYFFKY